METCREDHVIGPTGGPDSVSKGAVELRPWTALPCDLASGG